MSAEREAPAGIFLARPDARTQPDGVTLAVKDLFDTAGLTTTYGSSIFADHVPDRTAEAVGRLEAAGYVDVGKANLHEFAYGITSANPHFGTVPNPRWPGRMAGGSSGGSAAAVAAGLAELGLGTDSGGSVRIPAACCGLAGFKPTHGVVPLDGCFPLAPSFDHGGPIAATVAECRQAMAALAPGTWGASAAAGELRIGLAWLEYAEPLVRERVASAAALLGHVERVELQLADEVHHLFMREVAEAHSELFAEHAAEYGADVRRKLVRCLRVTDAEADASRRARDQLRERWLQSADGLDLLVTPTLGSVPPPLPVDDLAVRGYFTRLTLPVNATGWPALALPCGPAEDGIDASVQLIGRPGTDAFVLAAGEALESLLRATRQAETDADV